MMSSSRFPRARRSSRRLWWVVALTGLVAAVAPLSSAPVASAWTPGPQIGLSPWLSPGPSLSTSGDFATDTFSDPWDFSNPEDLPTSSGVGVSPGSGSISDGVLHVASQAGSEIRFLMKWPSFTGQVLPWGRDGWAHPIDSARYTQTTFSMRSNKAALMGVRFFTANGELGLLPFDLNASTGFQTFHFDLTDRKNFKNAGAQAVWSGPIVRFELFTATPGVALDIDWVRLHRADASRTPPANVPVPSVLTPNEEGGADYATEVRGNPWDFAGGDDIVETNHVNNIAFNSGDLTGNTFSNDSFVSVPLGAPLNPDKYHRFTVDVCYGGGFDLSGNPGGGMVGRLIWMPQGSLTWTETQDIVVFPGCNNITIDLDTAPAESLQDEFSTHPTGWRGVHISALRFDLNEDPGNRTFTLQNLKLADDAAFSTSYPITSIDVAGASGARADVYVTTNRAAYDGVKIAENLAVTGGVNTFNWNGTAANGAALPNGTYWVYVVMRNGAGTGVGYSTGPVRLEKAVAATPSYYVPLTPSRLLDTRTGIGGNLSALSDAWFTELDVTGVGGVPETNVTAVVMNVTADVPTSPGYLTAWPSGEPRPTVSSLNFVPGQTVPNLVTVKVGANGRVNLFNSLGNTHVVADVAGYYTTVPPAGGGRFTALNPSRLLDTRAGVGSAGGALGAGGSIDLDVTGVGGVPASDVQAVALNVTVDSPTASGFLAVWPTGEARPNASTHNFEPGLTVANMVVAKVGADGKVSIFNSNGASHVVADVIGYFSNTGGLFVPVTPTRLVDTRNDGTTLGTNDTNTVVVANSNPVPAGAKAVIVNVTSVNSTIPSYITVWPTGSTMPLASTLNPRPGVAVPNQAYLRVGANGSLDIYNAFGTTDVIVDVFGYVM